MNSRALGVLVAVVVPLNACWLAPFAANRTTTTMMRLGTALRTELAAGRWTPEMDLEWAVRLNTGIDSSQDGWGQELILEATPMPDGAEGYPEFRLTSLGRDGVRGSCCKRATGSDWDADAVLRISAERLAWLQVWQEGFL